MKVYYADSETLDFINSNEKKVYLYGSYGGYNNFGDIIQLKNTIMYYSGNTDYKPVVILHTSSLEYPGHVQKFKKWYNCEYFIFIADSHLDVSGTVLKRVDSVRSGSMLHVYGGGFLNGFWGRGSVEKIQAFKEDFGVPVYIFSGQQVELNTVPLIDEMFAKIGYPLLFGVRDRQSLEAMQHSSLYQSRVMFSFDDVTELFDLWIAQTKPTLKVRLIKRLQASRVMWHINTSHYATRSKNDIVRKIRSFKGKYPKHKALAAQAYNDTRLSLRDTLQSVVQIENDFPYCEYGVVNFAQMALDLQPSKGVYPPVGDVMEGVDIVVSSSYHIAMFSQFFNIPVYLMAENEFYLQKQSGLGLEADYSVFLNSPRGNLNKYVFERSARNEWLKVLGGLTQSNSELSGSTSKVVLIDYGSNIKMKKITYKSAKS